MWKALALALTFAAVVLSHPIDDSEIVPYEQIANEGAIRQKRDTDDGDAQVAEGPSGDAVQTDELQEAWADGNYARQGDDGQFIVASDFGGPIVQILQRVFRGGNCCACGCDCGCPGEEDTTEEPVTEAP